MLSAEPFLTLRQRSFVRQTRLALLTGFGGLLLLMGLLGVSAISSISRLEGREEGIRRQYVERSRAIENLRSDIYVSGTLVREYLLQPTDESARARRDQFERMRSQIEAEVQYYQRLVSPEGRDAFDQLRQQLDSWFNILTPALQWSAAQRRAAGYEFMQREVLPQRTALLSLADRVEAMAERNLELNSEAVGETMSTFRVRMVGLLILCIATGLGVASLSLWRLLRLERESETRFEEALRTREELKRLSAELLAAQETERRRISRELHDEVGQVLSAMSLSLANVRSAVRDGARDEAFRHLDHVQEMTERNLGVVRNIALLLRPTMLDDLGLVPAVRWLAREVSRTTDINTEVMAESFADTLPDEHRTCVFRIVQEAVRNAARHSGARNIRISLEQGPSGISASVQDDGKGFDPRQDKGLGMIGMEERALHLGGKLRITSERGRGAIVALELPVAGELKLHHAAEAEAQVPMTPLRIA